MPQSAKRRLMLSVVFDFCHWIPVCVVWFFTAINVFIGCVEFLEKPAMAFVRLNEAVLLESVLEVPVPVRFIFVLLGPTQTNMDYHEIGRSFSTLMSDKVHLTCNIYITVCRLLGPSTKDVKKQIVSDCFLLFSLFLKMLGSVYMKFYNAVVLILFESKAGHCPQQYSRPHDFSICSLGHTLF